MKKDLYDFNSKSAILNQIADHYIDTGLYEVEIIYFNKCPKKTENYKGKAVNISKYFQGELLGRFDICNYDYICDTELERENAKYRFFIMSCIGTGTVSECVPVKMMIGETGCLVDRMGKNTFEEIIVECDTFLGQLSKKALLVTWHLCFKRDSDLYHALQAVNEDSENMGMITYFNSLPEVKANGKKCQYDLMEDALEAHIRMLKKNQYLHRIQNAEKKGNNKECILTFELKENEKYLKIYRIMNKFGIYIQRVIAQTSIYSVKDKDIILRHIERLLTN